MQRPHGDPQLAADLIPTRTVAAEFRHLCHEFRRFRPRTAAPGRGGRSSWCNRLWLLKNSNFPKIRSNVEIENICPNRENRSQGILTRSNFCGYLGEEFFNSHRRLHQEPPLPKASADSRDAI